MFVVVASNSRLDWSVYGPFETQAEAEIWACANEIGGIDLDVLPVLDPSSNRKRGQLSPVKAVRTQG